MITGFPGETDEQFEEMVSFVKRWQFERLGVFTYSLSQIRLRRGSMVICRKM